MRDGFVFDDATGLIYVPKKYTEKNKKGELKVASSRIQLLYATADKGAENSISVKISEDGVDGDVAENGTAKVDILATDTKIVLAKDKAARESLKDSSIDSVIANGIEYTRDMDMWSYDEGTGTLDLKLAPAGVRTVKVKLTNDTGKTVGNFLTSIATKAFAGNVNNIGTWKFNTAPYVGMTFHTNGHNKYTGTPTGGYTMPAVENPSGGRYETKTIYQALGTQGVDVSALQSGNYSIERTCTINAQTTSSGVEIPNAANLNLTCGHVGVNPSGQLQNGYNQPKYTDDDYGQTVRVAAVYGNEAVVGVTVPTTFTQAGAGFFKVNWQLNKVNVTFSKISADAKVTNGNSEYSYAGAEFDIYRTRDNALVAHITMDGNGHANYQLDPNENYYAVETKAPQGFQKYEGRIEFSTGNSAGEQQFKDDPGYVKITVAKKDSATSGDPQTSLSLEGAEYKCTSISSSLWSAGCIYSILHNETYLGTLCQGRQLTPEGQFHSKKNIPKDQWVRTVDHHPAIIDDELLRRELKARKEAGAHNLHEQKKNFPPGIFGKEVRCASCGKILTKGKTLRKTGYERTLFCPTRKKSPSHCKGAFISEKHLESAILHELKNLADRYSDDRVQIGICQDAQSADLIQERNRLKTAVELIEKEITAYEQRSRDLYLKRATDGMSIDDFNSALSRIRNDVDKLRLKSKRASSELLHLNESIAAESIRMETVLKAADFNHLDKTKVSMLIESVYVHKRDPKSGTQAIDITWKF